MGIKNILKKLKSKLVEPKVYSGEMICVFKNAKRLFLRTGYSLEEVLKIERAIFAQELNVNEGDIGIFAYIEKTSEELFNDFSSQEEYSKLQIVEVLSIDGFDKNSIMKRIIDEKDSDLFEKFKSGFSSYEIQLLTDKLSQK